MKLMIGPVLLLLSLVSVSCQQNGNVVELELQFDWVQQNECSEVSPEILVTGIPVGTPYLEVCLTDLYMPGADHGGWGKIPCPENGVIASGTLKHFRGPCPPKYYGSSKYEFAVRSIDANGNVTGIGKLSKECCPDW